jgi:uncharacterized tellurite resistance protein B-like protein
MHLLLSLVAIIAAIGFWYWRARMAAQAAREASSAAKDARLFLRRIKFQRNSKEHPIDAVDDPRLAAAGVIVTIAQMDGDLSKAEIASMETEARIAFNVDEVEGGDIVAFGRWIAGQSTSPEETVRKLAKVVRAQAGPEAWPQLIAMIETVASADGRPLTERQEESLHNLRSSFGL